jgi:hypothetical protein
MKKWDIAGVADRWKEAYCGDGWWRNDTSWRNGISSTTDREAIYLLIVDANGDAAQINAAIGNDTWTRFHCAECNSWKTSGATFDNWDGGYVTICTECIRKALAL